MLNINKLQKYKQMKKLCISFMVICFAMQAYPQHWVEMMQDPSVNFYTVQKEFNKYWIEKNKVQNNWFRRLISFGKDAEMEKAGWEVFKRWEYFTEQRVYPKGNRIEPDKAWKEFQQFVHKYKQKSIQQAGNWVPLGPTAWQTTSYNPGIGRVNGIAVDPNNSSIIYAGAPSGGFWKSTNGGTSWNTTTDTLPIIGVSSIVVDFTNSNHIYIATGDGDAGDTYSIGVLESFDGGNSWNTTGLSYSTSLYRKIGKIIMHPVNHSILYAVTNVGIYGTTDGGTTWTNRQSGNFRDIEFKPNHPDVIYACGNVFYRSVNGGNSFAQITSGLPASNVSRFVIAVSPADSNYVYIVAGNNNDNGFEGFYLSTNGGTNFTQQSNSPNLLGYDENGNDSGGQSWYDLAIAVSPSNKNEVYAGGINIWKSTDGGVSWNISTHWFYDLGGLYPYVHADQHSLDFFGNTLLAGCDGGIFKSTDFGTSWTDISAGIEITQFYRMAGTPTEPYMLMGGSQDNGCNRLKNGIWTHVLGADGMEVAIHPGNTQIVYAESQNGGINRSFDGGDNFMNAVGNITGSGNWITPYMLDPNNPNTIYAGYEDVWKSTTGGTVWSKISNFTGTDNIGILNVAPSNSNVIYATKGNTLYKTTDGGTLWTNISTGLPAGVWMTYLTIHPTNPNKIWITFSGFSPVNKVFKSIDGGATWTNYTSNLPNLPVNCIIAQIGSPDGVYIGTDIGVFYRDTTLINWQPYWNGLPNVIADELEINYGAGKIRAATFGRGMWESDLYTPAAIAPVAGFSADKTELCPGDSVLFTNLTINVFTTCQWSFPGGNPSATTAINPVVIYPTAGTYNAQLIVENMYGSDTLLKTLYINVADPVVQTTPLAEGFQGTDFPPLNWKNIIIGGCTAWEKTDVTGGYSTSTSSARNNNYSVDNRGISDILLSPAYNMNNYLNPILHFDYAYSRYSIDYSDTLRIFYTSDCAVTKNYLWTKGGTALATSPDNTNLFVPAPGEWLTDFIDLSSIATTNSVQFGFENRSGYGNYLYVDNINIDGFTSSDVEIYDEQISVFPNPCGDVIELKISGNNCKEFEIKILNILGQTVVTKKSQSDNNNIINIDLYGLPKSVYFLNITANDKSFNKKILKIN